MTSSNGKTPLNGKSSRVLDDAPIVTDEERGEEPADVFEAPRNGAGHEVDDAGSEPRWSQESVTRGGDEICNAIVTRAEKEKIVEPLPMTEIIGRAKAKTGDWPRRTHRLLFVHEAGEEIGFLEKPPALFGYLGAKCGRPSRFVNNDGCHTKQEVFEEFRRTATAYRRSSGFRTSQSWRATTMPVGFPNRETGNASVRLSAGSIPRRRSTAT